MSRKTDVVIQLLFFFFSLSVFLSSVSETTYMLSVACVLISLT